MVLIIRTIVGYFVAASQRPKAREKAYCLATRLARKIVVLPETPTRRSEREQDVYSMNIPLFFHI